MDMAKIIIGDKTVECPIIEGTEGEIGIDISSLRKETGAVTLDYGFVNTASCESKITFINGEKGILRYRGYSLEELAENFSFLETSYLLLKGNRPSKDELESFEKEVLSKGSVDKNITQIIKSFPEHTHPMAVLGTGVNALSGYYEDTSDELKLLGILKTLAAQFYRHSHGLKIIESSPSRNFCEDFVAMMFGEDKVDPIITKALDVLFILHADHEQNCSTSTVRLVGSSGANLFTSITAGINALWGPLHGGANQAVIEMLEAIKSEGGDYRKFIEKAKDKTDPFRLMGFGHRVYKNFDPRARIIKRFADEILSKLGVNDQVLDIAKGLEEEALKDSYFAERKLYPNVDFYSGIIYRALGIPTNMFTVMFALGRLPGWLAQWKEMNADQRTRIGRPRQIYQGEKLRS